VWLSVADEDAIHILDDGNFYYEVTGLPEIDPEEAIFPLAKKASKVKFSTSPMKVFFPNTNRDTICKVWPLKTVPVVFRGFFESGGGRKLSW